ncbi:MAG: ABC transporter ATP-binding protein [Deltaproteobacteria bacterium]|nr:ABC transporter ATP-binding protein [Deltaproteobacteria bacterium]MBW1923680.1 ABC transporter ATP-binding protein [Deltaproteobacteria bacterium]MBW1950743.1 ABC transporter ATP-binding protein [Deltaproteobacteria bacterium]MBW2008378.1 ABC transporter ATP-binding protein [Deltaproteobacteria bacterium]MBW2102594.1 ABC transporter ATP-binding protein [Deltaproteobacteria bacterium]
MALLKVECLTKRFGGLVALDRVSLEVEEGHIMGVIGPNGAGKTTLFGTISGFHKPQEGAVYFRGRRIDGLKPHRICKMGLVRTFQIAQPFPGFTPLETLVTAALNTLPLARARKRAREVLEMVGLAEKAQEEGGNLTIADQKALEVGKAIATGGRLILLDEVMAGLTVLEAQTMMSLVKRLQAQGFTFLMVEHVMYVIMKLCDRIVVLNFGQKIAEGTPGEIAGNKTVIDAYIGEEAAVAG